jgi:hypothetical protein
MEVAQMEKPDIIIQRPANWGRHYVIAITLTGERILGSSNSEVPDFQSLSLKRRLELEGAKVEYQD